jgi:hypothetical protein
MKARAGKQKAHKGTNKEAGEVETPEQVPAAESLRRMKAFIDRKENFVAAIKKSKN